MSADGPPLNVAVVITELDPGGAERALVEIVTRWPRDWSVHVYSLGGESELTERLRVSGVTVTSLSASKRRPFAAVRRLRGHLKEQSPDVLQTWLFHGNLVGRLAAIGIGVPVVATHRVAERSAGWHVTLERLTGRLVDRHVAVSESVAAFLRERNVVRPTTPVSVVPNGVDVDRVRPRNPSGDGFHVVAAGRLHPQKGFDDLLLAWRRLGGKLGAEATLTIYGEGPDRRKLESLAAEATYGVALPGRVPDLFAPLAEADLFVLPSHWEGMPNVVLEAAAAGCPIVATDVEGVQELLGPDSPLVAAADPGSLAHAIRGVFEDRDRAKTAARSTQRSVSSRFTWEKSSTEMAAVLRAAIDQHARKKRDLR